MWVDPLDGTAEYTQGNLLYFYHSENRSKMCYKVMTEVLVMTKYHHSSYYMCIKHALKA